MIEDSLLNSLATEVISSPKPQADAAFKRIVDIITPTMMNVVKKYNLLQHDYDDRLQIVFMSLFSAMKNWQPKGKFINFAITVATRCMIDKLREQFCRITSVNDIPIGLRQKQSIRGISQPLFVAMAKEEYALAKARLTRKGIDHAIYLPDCLQVA